MGQVLSFSVNFFKISVFKYLANYAHDALRNMCRALWEITLPSSYLPKIMTNIFHMKIYKNPYEDFKRSDSCFRPAMATVINRCKDGQT
jgi:hypothetical protein